MTDITDIPIPSTENALFRYYDIESIDNVFSVVLYLPSPDDVRPPLLDLFVLSDLPETVPDLNALADRIRTKNPALPDTVQMRIYNLRNKVHQQVFSEIFRPVPTDLDETFNPEKHPYLVGYNSAQYDLVMLAMFLHELDTRIESEKKGTPLAPLRASTFREYNDEMFRDYKSKMTTYLSAKPLARTLYYEMQHTGRHVDAAMLNEAQQHTSLKRQSGALGYQILESENLRSSHNTLRNLDELYDLLAYNVSDVIALYQLFQHSAYAESFNLKQTLQAQYPETRRKDDGTPLTYGKLRPDSTSAQHVAKILCPTGELKDIPAVSYEYPFGARNNILDDTEEYYEYITENMPNKDTLRAAFRTAIAPYRNVEGKNFNDSLAAPSWSVKEITFENTALPYINADGTPSRGYAIFSIGGIHGAEYNLDLYQQDCREIDEYNESLAIAKKMFPEPTAFKRAKGATITLSSGKEIRYTPAVLLKPKATLKSAEWRDEKPYPALFPGNKLATKYTITSMGMTFHEDFTSYYPNLLMNMQAFQNPTLGEDRYKKIFEQKERYGQEMKQPSLTPAERTRLATLRNGTKLILNSASGAADMSYGNSIRMNNRIISMRILGQLLTWRIGQAQTLAGGTIVSTNTDGLYCAGLDEETNNRTLAKEAEKIHIAIEPEPTLLASRNSNFRLEVAPKEHDKDYTPAILGASGGALACYNGPTPTKSLAHPAVMDRVLAEYLRAILTENPLAENGTAPLSIEAPLDREVALQFLRDVQQAEDSTWALMMFQTIVQSSPGTISYTAKIIEQDGNTPAEYEVLPHTSRVFFVQDNQHTLSADHLCSIGAWKITPAEQKKRQINDLVAHNDHEMQPVIRALQKVGVARHGQHTSIMDTTVEDSHDFGIHKITGIDPEWLCHIENRDLHCLDESERRALLNALDLDIYLSKIETTYEKGWRNTGTDSTDDTTESDA